MRCDRGGDHDDRNCVSGCRLSRFPYNLSGGCSFSLVPMYIISLNPKGVLKIIFLRELSLFYPTRVWYTRGMI